MADPRPSNRTILALSEVVSQSFDFQVNVGGTFEQRTRPDWLGDLLFADEFKPSLVQLARGLYPVQGAIKRFVLGLCPGGEILGALSQSEGIQYGPEASDRLLLKLAGSILRHAQSRDTLVKPSKHYVDRLVSGLELNGFEIRDGHVVVREENVFDVDEAVGSLDRLFTELGLEAREQFTRDLRLTDEHYMSEHWGDSIKHSRDALEVALLCVARAVSTAKGKNLARSALPGPVRAFLKDNGVVDEIERDFLYALHTLLSVQGGHANMSEREHARICRQYALTAAHFILLRHQRLREA